MAAVVPAAVVLEGKIPAAWFLEQVGAKGMQLGDIHVAGYHANLIYNAGHGTAPDLCALIAELMGPAVTLIDSSRFSTTAMSSE